MKCTENMLIELHFYRWYQQHFCSRNKVTTFKKFSSKFFNLTLWQMVSYDEKLITENFYVENTIGFRDKKKSK